MRETDVENGYLTDRGRRRFAIQRLALHLAFWPGVLLVAVSCGAGMRPRDLALSRAQDALNARGRLYVDAREKFLDSRRLTLGQVEGVLTISSDPAREEKLRRLGDLRRLNDLELEALSHGLEITGTPEAFTTATDSQGQVHALNATADGRLSGLQPLSQSDLVRLGAEAVQRAAEAQGQRPEVVLQRDLARIRREVDEQFRGR